MQLLYLKIYIYDLLLTLEAYTVLVSIQKKDSRILDNKLIL